MKFILQKYNVLIMFGDHFCCYQKAKFNKWLYPIQINKNSFLFSRLIVWA